MSFLDELEDRIGYHFKKKGLLRQAMTHSSYANEKFMKKFSDNERLEFLGDAVLEVTSSEYLYLNYPNIPEGDLTKLRASLVCEPTLAVSAKEIDLGKYLLLGKGEDATGGRGRKSVNSDAMEALIGAIYLDGGFSEAKKFVEKFILTDIDNKKLFYDSKSSLQEIVQGNHEKSLHYNLLGEDGPDHNKMFYVEVRLGDKVIGKGDGHSKKAAEQDAAYQALMFLKKNPL